MIKTEMNPDGLDQLRVRLGASRATHDGKNRTEEQLLEDERIMELHALGTARGFELIRSDPKFIKDFWAQGYLEFSSHFEHNTTQWMGKRIWNLFLLTIIGVIFAYLMRSGVVK